MTLDQPASLVLSALTADDYDSMNDAFIRAMDLGIIYPLVYPPHLRTSQQDTIARRSALLRLAAPPADPSTHLKIKATRPDAPHVVIGYAHWVLRQTGAESANEPTPSAEYQAIEAEDRATMHPRAPELTAKRRALHRASEEREMGPDSRNKGKQYYHLQALLTHPSYARQGIAGALMSHGLAIADERNLACYLTASPMGEPLYAKNGFKEVERFSVTFTHDDGREQLIEYPAMVRDPKGEWDARESC